MSDQTTTDLNGGPDAEPESSGPVQDPEWTQRYRLRLRAALEVLGRQERTLTTSELRALAAQAAPLTAYDASVTASGAVRAWVNLGFNLTTICEHAGWLHATSEAGFRLTREGRHALAAHRDPQSLFEAANRAYQDWDAARTEHLTPAAASSDHEVLHGGSGTAHALRACAPVLAAWRSGGSAFSPGTAVWSPDATSSLRIFLESAQTPLDPVLSGLDDPTARALVAEAQVLLCAPFIDLSGHTKRSRGRNPFMPAVDPPGLPWRLSADLEHGFVHGGKLLAPTTALTSFVRLLGHWWSLPSSDRDAAWVDPWAFRDHVAAASGVDDRIAALVCLLVHPGTFTTVLRSGDRRRVVEAFADRLDASTGDTERNLTEITLRLQAEQGGTAVRYDAPPLLQEWSQNTEGGRAWLVRGEVDQQNRVPAWRRQGQVTLTAGRLTHLPSSPSQAALGSMVDDRYADLPVVKREAKKRDVLAFVLGVQPSDLVATVDGGSLRLGRVDDGSAALQAIGGQSLLTRPVAWDSGTATLLTDLPGALRSRVRFTGEDVVDLTDLLTALEALGEDDDPSFAPDVDGADEAAVPEPEQAPLAPAVLSCDTTALARELLHADSSWVDELLVSLNERRQVVLEGPPGTGKTYLVQRLLAACGVVEGQSALVQFHPTYSYEDFVEGFRPVATSDLTGAALTVQPGPLKRIADEARNAPGKPFVLVIDEINRANLAKVFGELYFLLEYRDAEVELLYSAGERFALPQNLFVIGTMNTADRSIALLDAAMRRRFVFLSMATDEPALAGVLARWCEDAGRPAGLAQLRDRLNAAMHQRGLDLSLAFGPSYFMRSSSADAAGLDRLWRRELRPMLLEHHYGDHEQVDGWYPFHTWVAQCGLSSR